MLNLESRPIGPPSPVRSLTLECSTLAPPPSADPSTGDTGKHRRVLIVDDDIDLGESLQDVLMSRNYEVAIAHNCATAIEVAATFNPQVAMLDVNLGQERGLSLIESLKQRAPRLLCVAISARAEFDIAIEALRLGAFDYLIKPLHPVDLFSRLDRCFERSPLSVAPIGPKPPAWRNRRSSPT
jgi:two-component system, repressor protein LuxO